MQKPIPNLEQLRSDFDYQPETGLWFRYAAVGRPSKDGQAGTIGPKGYRIITTQGHRYPASKLSVYYVTGKWPRYDTDHINRQKGNNVYTNLRDATRSQNLANTPLSKNNKTGIKGVMFCKKLGKYKVQVQHNGKNRHIGLFNTFEDARSASQKIREKLFGDYAYIGAQS